jgi:hypothetical protein
VEDDHVDRPDVDAQQCVQLTGTNHSNDLIALIINPSPAQPRMRLSRGEHRKCSSDLREGASLRRTSAMRSIVGSSRCVAPRNPPRTHPAFVEQRLSRGEQTRSRSQIRIPKPRSQKDPASATIAPQSRCRGPDNRRAMAGGCFKTVLRRPGDFCRATRPDPIPNSAVKRPSANGTMSQDLGE